MLSLYTAIKCDWCFATGKTGHRNRCHALSNCIYMSVITVDTKFFSGINISSNGLGVGNIFNQSINWLSNRKIYWATSRKSDSPNHPPTEPTNRLIHWLILWSTELRVQKCIINRPTDVLANYSTNIINSCNDANNWNEYQQTHSDHVALLK